MERELEPEVMSGFREVDAFGHTLKANFGAMADIEARRCGRILRDYSGNTGNKIMDIGCGLGGYLRGLSGGLSGHKFYMVDYSANMLSRLRKNLDEKPWIDAVVIRADGKRLPFRDDCFDMIFSLHMLHHIPNPLNVLRELMRTVKKGGVIYILDLVRPSSRFLAHIYVSVFGFFYNRLMKKEYLDSLCAAFTIAEYEAIARDSGLCLREFNKIFPGHVELVAEKK